MSSNKYVPPHMRNKPQEERKPRYQSSRYDKPQWKVLEEEEEARRKEKQDQGLENTEQNFPALSTAAPKSTFAKKSFAEIALAGHEKSEQEAMKKTLEENYHSIQGYNPIVLPKLERLGRYVEPEEDDQPKPLQNEDGWVTVDRKKHRKKKTIEEIVQEDEEEQKQQEEQNTVWGEQLEEHETCWDERY